jgi:hypothetical protein
MHLFRILLLASIIAGTFSFGHGRTGMGRHELCTNECKNQPMVLIVVFKLPSKLGCQWSRERAMGISVWAGAGSSNRQYQEFCASCPDPAACL